MLDMNAKITIKNLTSFPVGFIRINGQGEVNIPANTSVLVERAEVVSQVQSGSILFCGEKHDKAHPWIFIDDKETRIYVGFDTEKVEQSVINEAKIKEVFDIKSKAQFEKAVKALVITFAEKKLLVETMNKLKVNDYNKIKFVEKYTGIPVNIEDTNED